MPLGVDDVEGGEARHLPGKRDGEQRDADRERPSARGCWREQPGGDDRERSGAKHDARCADGVEQGDQDEAAERRAHQVRRVDGVDLRGEARNGQRDDEAAREEGHGGQQVDEQHQRQVLPRVVQPDPEPNEASQGADGARGEDERPRRQERRRGDLVQTIASQERVDAAGAQPEERDRDRQECKVVVHDDREDARERELGHQQRGRDGGHGDEGARDHQRNSVLHAIRQRGVSAGLR